MSYKEFVRIVVQDARKRVLVVVHRDAQNDIINLPGGKVDPGETPEEAVQREFFEETGMFLTSAKLINKKEFTVHGVDWKGYFYWGESSCTAPRNMEPNKHSFVGFCDHHYIQLEGHREFVAEPIALATKLGLI